MAMAVIVAASDEVAGIPRYFAGIPFLCRPGRGASLADNFWHQVMGLVNPWLLPLFCKLTR
jgi:hypothetical protein